MKWGASRLPSLVRSKGGSNRSLRLRGPGGGSRRRGLSRRRDQRRPQYSEVRPGPPSSVRSCGITVAWNEAPGFVEYADIGIHLPRHIEAAGGIEPPYGALQG